MTCRRAVYAAEPYHGVVDLPFGEKRGFEATTYRPWSLEVGRMSRLLIYTWEGTTVRSILITEFSIVVDRVMYREAVNVMSTDHSGEHSDKTSRQGCR
jgi:hypothetical protein